MDFHRSTISDPPMKFRLSSPRGITEGAVDRDAGIINGYSVATRGEALGHGMWLDSDFLDSIVKAGNKTRSGIKSRFTHPGLSGDGMGKLLGRSKNFRRDGDQVFADLHFIDAASRSPEGNLSEYVMSLAEESPEMFGASIVFTPDRVAQEKFRAKNVEPGGKFKSPDAENGRNLTHARLAAIHASDVVDEPAANPEGMFSEGSELAAKAEMLLAFMVGLSDEIPPVEWLGPNPERMKTFFQDFISRHGITLGREIPIEHGEEAPGFSIEVLSAMQTQLEAEFALALQG